MNDNIKVVVKVRPLISRELEENLSYQWRVHDNTLCQIDQNGKDVLTFTFDKVYGQDTKTSDVYHDIAKPIVEAAIAGFNGTIFAYGQTSSGKTYTMTGTDDEPGIIPLAIMNLFEIIKNVPNRDFLVRVSYLEIYNETLIDLLNIERKNIKIQDTIHGVKVDATEKVTSSPEEILDVMNEGKANRQTGATSMNEESSRSHSIFQITIESREHIEGEEEVGCVNVSQLNLVDLAGSERAGQTGATGLRFKEGTHINKSLSSLALVIKQLSEDNKHVNCRDSKLTRILQNSLGGNAKTSIICAVTPAAVEETISTLQFANRAKSIKNKPAVNAVATNATNATMIQKLTKQLSSLKTELENKKSLEKDNFTLQKQIASLQKLILNGFAQRSTADMFYPQRKPVHPRRITISTLHSVQQDPVPTVVPKFCTPALKYNPLVIPRPSEFPPIQNAPSLPTLPEEPQRAVTPPPRDKKVNLDAEIIELDSDDDRISEPDSCPSSPHHNCYKSSKTPPCILRKNAKRAEKDLKDIVELTGREKIFTPSVVELMEKLEENAAVIIKLEDEINALNALSKEKDFEMEKLKFKITKAEKDMNMISSAKIELETICKEYTTKLTDSEVSYETLKKKAKNREEELLSLLEEREPKKNLEPIGKISTIENGEFPIETENKHCINDINTSETLINQISELKAQLALKDSAIQELELAISEHKEKVAYVENTCKIYETQLEDYKEKLTLVEKQLLEHKDTVDSLNTIIETQNDTIKTFNADIESYNKLIQELQIKLRNKDNININNKELETLIASEEMTIANNENIKNIVQSLKIALQSKSKEIKTLKSALEKTKSPNFENLKEEIANKTSEIVKLTEEIKILKTEQNDNTTTIIKLQSDQHDFFEIEKKLKNDLTDVEKYKENLTKENESLSKQIKELKAENEELTKKVDIKDLALAKACENHTKEIQDKCNEIEVLENDNLSKAKTIALLNKAHEETQKHFDIAKSSLCKVQSVITILTGNVNTVPDIIDNFVFFFNTLVTDLCRLEEVASTIMQQKNELTNIIEQFENYYDTIEIQIDSVINNLSIDLDIMKTFEEEHDVIVTNFVSNNREPINSTKIQPNLEGRHNTLKYKLNKLVKILDIKQIVYQQNITSKDIEIAELKSYHDTQKSKEILLLQKQKHDLERKSNELLTNVLNKCLDLTVKYNIENSVSCKFENIEQNVYEEILLTLDKIANHLEIVKNNSANDNVEEVLKEAKKEITELTEQNLKFIDDISRMEATNIDLSEALDKIKQVNNNLAKDLKKSGEVLELLQQDLKIKVSEMDKIESKAKQWKDQFVTLDFLIKEQMHALKLENANLCSRYSASISKINHKYCYQSCESETSSCQQSICSDNKIELKSPQSLLTLCCNILVDVIQPNDSISQNHTRSSSKTNINETAQNHICQCDRLELELERLTDENVKLGSVIKQLQSSNQDLMNEHNEVQHEVKSLLDFTYELQKRVINHRTNLSTLTATTYAENKSLSYQNKFLQHLHNRFYTVCQRDIPAFKKQLQELMTLLKNETSNESIKRFSFPNALDSSSILPNLKNESTLDGDFLMLDTNVTLTTTGDTTLAGHDQTCFDVTQVSIFNEVACQTIDFCPVTTSLDPQNTSENYEIGEKLEELKKENSKLRDMVEDYRAMKRSKNSLIDVQTSPFKSESYSDPQFVDLSSYEDLLTTEEQHLKEIELLTQKITTLQSENTNILEKYNNLLLEIPSTDALVKKLCILEKEQSLKTKEIDSLKSKICSTNKEMAALQDENDNLSTQVMENISELDDLKKEYDKLKLNNAELLEKNSQFQIELETTTSTDCPICATKDKLIRSLQEKVRSDSHVRLSRSFSDSDRSSSYNTICTLQNELHAGKEDCDKLKEEVTTIKNHLDRSNRSIVQSMDLDESISESNIYSSNKEFDSIEPKCSMPDIPEERLLDMYALDKTDCLNYYIEITGNDTEALGRNIKIIEVMKLLYNNMLTRHANQVENLINKLRDFEDSKKQFQLQLEDIAKEHLSKTKELQEKCNELDTLKQMFANIKNNILVKSNNGIEINDIVKTFKEYILKPLDSHCGVDSINIFEIILNTVEKKLQDNLVEKTDQCSKLEINLGKIQDELNTVNVTLADLKSELLNKNNDYDLLKKQKDKIQEISNAVTLDIVKKEQELNKIMTDGCDKLLQHCILEQEHIDQIMPLNKNIESMFDLIIKQFNDKKETAEKQQSSIIEDMTKLKSTIEAQNIQLESLSACLQEKDIDLQKKDMDLLTQSNLAKDFKEIYDKKVEESNLNTAIISKMREEIVLLQESLSTKQAQIQTLDSNRSMKDQIDSLKLNVEELLHTKDSLEQEISSLKIINHEITKEKKDCVRELNESRDTITKNMKDLETLTTDIIVLKESVKENINIISNLKKEIKTLFDDNSHLKQQLQEKTKDCSRLEMNIKTHEKTAEIQSRIIIRLQKQKEFTEKDKLMEELKLKCGELQSQCDTLQQAVKTSKDELTSLQNTKQILEVQLSELQEAHKPRLSIDLAADSSRRRRQSIHDSKRTFAEDKLTTDADDNNKMEIYFGSRKNDDSLMDVDGMESNRSTPLRLSKGRDSSQFKNDQSDKDEDPPSRPSSVLAARRRRQSLHDMHRSVLPQTPSPHDNTRVLREVADVQKLDSHHEDSEVTQLKNQLASCQEELEDLRERCKELDDECETCAQYLRERDEQCSRLKREKLALEQTISELQAKIQANHSFNRSERRASFSDAAVNTDADWTNLYSVVVDRMSYDAEVEKNKKLTRTIEELRSKQQELKATMARMQTALEKKSLNDNRCKELEAVKAELHSCMQELQEIKKRCEELDEECETCAEYLRERDEQCLKLKKAKAALEAKLKDYEDSASNVALSVRKKRQTLHDENRASDAKESVDASTETNEDFLSYQVEKDVSQEAPTEAQVDEIKRLRVTVDRLSQQKEALEQRLAGTLPNLPVLPVLPAPLYVATGSAIVQNQQLTDVMKENQKLKKMNAKLITICKKRGKTLTESNRENLDPSEQV